MNGTDGSEIYFKGQCQKTPELIDKMSWWSSVLDSWLLFATVHGISKLETIETIVFFGHQCNTTPLFCQAMRNLLLDFDKIRRNKLFSSKRCSMYTLLVQECQDLTGNKGKSSDTGSYGKDPRFSPSHAKVLDEDGIASSCMVLREIFDSASKLMNDVRTSQNSAKGILDRLCITKAIIHRITSIESLPSIGELRAMHILQFATLTGLVPLEFYVYIPLHFSGGPRHWLEQGLGLKKSDFKQEEEFLAFYSEFLYELQQLFNREVTSNIVEQSSCYSARTVVRFDHWLSIPRYVNAQRKDDGSKYLKGDFENCHLQHFFRVFGNRTSKWELQMFDGNEKRCLFQTKPQKYKNFCCWIGEILYFEK